MEFNCTIEITLYFGFDFIKRNSEEFLSGVNKIDTLTVKTVVKGGFQCYSIC